jgi:hypothetical protein
VTDDPPTTAAVLRNGWLHAEDLGRMDAVGRVSHGRRLKDMIRRSGENVAAREVKEVLLTHVGVRLAAVAAVPDELRSEEVKGVIRGRRRHARGTGRLLPGAPGRVQGARFWQPAADLPGTDPRRVAKAGLADLASPVFDTVTGEWDRHDGRRTAAGQPECAPACGGGRHPRRVNRQSRRCALWASTVLARFRDAHGHMECSGLSPSEIDLCLCDGGRS